ncbi:hypothetical protein AcW1_004984 [Taiwanofungus camphoratus]|nr:hypothetical protein AcW2_006005 [Antrodia cinnamomea]KAI0941261.1 hypothetical protein AcV7_002877 [Antrodia cinnamomea]KAI0960479.1 hypothetical protein AcW1_004984 [Antrodia cinnamomea]
MTSARSLFPAISSFPVNRTVSASIQSRGFSHNAESRNEHDHRASSKLLEDAAREEAEEAAAPARQSKLSILENQNENWTGEESMRDAVLRMLVDKYKPLRSGVIRTADEKLKQAPPQVIIPDDAQSNFTSDTSTVRVEESGAMANEPLLPSIEGHKPWHTTFKVPSHATTSVRYGYIPTPASRRLSPSELDERTRRKEKEARKRSEHAGRLSRARESTIDYRLGIKGPTMTQHRRPNPVTLKGWASLVEERIEKARQEGHFNVIKGRGQPLASTTQDKNPFIAREEFLMNRIVQRQGAAPPWVEIQGELESAIASFREVLKQSWTRRAIRMLTVSQPAALLPKLTLTDVTSLRDAEWEARERGFHDQALEELNALVRKYNGLAPYAVRRVYYARDAELERAYRDSAEGILQGLSERAKDEGGKISVGVDHSEEEASGSGPTVTLTNWRIRDMIRDLWTALRGR